MQEKNRKYLSLTLLLVPMLILISIFIMNLSSFDPNSLFSIEKTPEEKYLPTLTFTLIIFYIGFMVYIFYLFKHDEDDSQSQNLKSLSDIKRFCFGNRNSRNPKVKLLELKKEEIDDICLSDNLPKNEKKKRWKDIQSVLEKESKTEVLSLIKKNKIENDLEFKDTNFSLENIFKLKNYINILHTLHDIMHELHEKKQEKNNNNSLKMQLYQNEINDLNQHKMLLSHLICSIKFNFHKLSKGFATQLVCKIFAFFVLIGLFAFIGIPLTSQIEIADLYIFILGMLFSLESLPIGMLYYHTLKYYRVNNYPNSTHKQPLVLFRNIFYLRLL
ncbi:MAG: hypothetical protein U9N49_09095 [Campylobacterota bacterium]|nr:hypothetical protein [Campylobacterota bacterium]